ncbi:poly(R)-hydroxyalkanoic acid synthase, class II [compost metagenome]
MTGGELADDAQEWKEGAKSHNGSWWNHWQGWLTERSGAIHAAPESLGSDAHPAGVAAPGTYVHMC